LAWIVGAYDRQFVALVAAALSSWSASFIALWAGLAGLFVGGFLGAKAINSTPFPHHLIGTGVGQSVTLYSILGTAIATAGVAIGATYAHLLFSDPRALAITMIGGFLIAGIVTVVIAALEADLLKLRGYRRPSRDEARIIAPSLQSVGQAMGLSRYPRFAVSDSLRANAWCHMRHIVITTGLLKQLEPDELSAVLAHELHHWRRSDSVAAHLVWAAALPIALLVDIIYLVMGWSPDQTEISITPKTIYQLLGWLIVWPAWILGRFIIAPAAASAGRAHEYDADAAAKELGLAGPLASALVKIVGFETARSGWEQCVMATHPPLELRLEALQPPKIDDADYQEGPLGLLFADLQS